MRFGTWWGTRWFQTRMSCAASCAAAALRLPRQRSRATFELRLSKGPGVYVLPNGNGSNGAAADVDDSPPSVAEMIESFGLRASHAMNQVVVRTVMGGAQPLAAALDYEGWPEVVGTIAGDDTVLVICPDPRRAGEVEARLRTILES